MVVDSEILCIKDKLSHFVPSYPTCSIWDKVFKNGPSKVCGRQGLKNLKWYGLLTYHLKFFKGCLPQILLGPFLNNFSHIQLHHGLIFNMLLILTGFKPENKIRGRWIWESDDERPNAFTLAEVGLLHESRRSGDMQVPQRFRAESWRRLWRSVKNCEKIAFCDSY